MSRTYTQDQRKALALKIKQLKEQGVKGVDISVQLGIPHGTVNSLLSSFFKPIVTYKKREGVDIEETKIEGVILTGAPQPEKTNYFEKLDEKLNFISLRLSELEIELENMLGLHEKTQAFFNALFRIAENSKPTEE